ncbi:MAG: Arc family DNA-binding protein [Gemmatimonadetes bacterium]|nr:Arc family DNA-binding protein [Gemmatimonadota bacterium]
MATITIKNVPEELYERLKRDALRNRRSMNREAIACLERALGAERVEPERFLAEAGVIRERLGGVYVTEKELARFRREGRR